MTLYYKTHDLAKSLGDKLNDEAGNHDYGLTSIYPNEAYQFNIIADTGEYKRPSIVGNNVTNYINGEYTVVSNDIEGVDNDTFNAVIEMRVDFLVPLKGPERKNTSLLKAIRYLVSNDLKYTETN